MYLNTKNRCFFCLKEIVKEEGVVQDEESKISDLSLIGESYLFQVGNLCHHLQTNLSDPNVKKELKIIGENPFRNVKNQHENERLKLNVSLCQPCRIVGKEFTKLFQELERLQVKIEGCVARIHQEMAKSSIPAVLRRRGIPKVKSGRVNEEASLKLVNILRDEILKCSNVKLDALEVNTKTDCNSSADTDEDHSDPDESLTDDDSDFVPEDEEALSPSSSLSIKEELEEDPLCDEEISTNNALSTSVTTSASSTITLSQPIQSNSSANPQQSNFLLLIPGEGMQPSKQIQITPDILQQSGIEYVFNPVTKRFACTACPAKYKKHSSAKTHYEAIHLNIKHKCDLCGFLYRSRIGLIQHRRKCKDVQRRRNEQLAEKQKKKKYMYNSITKKYSCTRCPKQFSTVRSCVLHYRTIHLRESYKCDICNVFEFTQIACLTNHKKTCEKLQSELQKRNETTTQPSIPPNKEGQNRKDEQEVDFKKYPCPTCGVRLSRTNINRHIRTKHLNQRNYVCEKCGIAYFDLAEMKKHKKPLEEGKMITCRSCSEKFHDRCSSRLHKMVCSKKTVKKLKKIRKEKKEKTSKSKQFASNQSSSKNDRKKPSRTAPRRKIVIENEDQVISKPDANGNVTCLLCGNKYAQKGNAKKHYRANHLNEREHVCEICGKAFQEFSFLRVHQEMVHLKKRYTCEECKVEYADKRGLIRHKEKCHASITPI